MSDQILRLLQSPSLKPFRRLFEGPARRLFAPYLLSGDASTQWFRIVMNRETRKLVESLDPASLKVLEISGDYWSEPGLFREYKSVGYPEYDVCSAALQESFDLVIAEQVFEHLLWPYRAGRNVYSMLNPGGAFLVTTPFLVRVHLQPQDCTRWTETGLKHLLAECGFPLSRIQTGSWGNRSCIKANLGPRWQIYQPWRHSLKNDPAYPGVVWALARK